MQGVRDRPLAARTHERKAYIISVTRVATLREAAGGGYPFTIATVYSYLLRIVCRNLHGTWYCNQSGINCTVLFVPKRDGSLLLVAKPCWL